MRVMLLVGSLVLALVVGVLALQVPAPRGPDTPARDFSAARAMTDVQMMAQRPHPVGSADHARVQTALVARMTAMGLSPTLQSGPVAEKAQRRLAKWGLDPNSPVVNIVGRLPGRDPSKPAVMLMAHYDSVAKSPGAADDATGVAAILEAVRAILARGPADRDLIVLLTDGEELALDGAQSFFTTHPWRDRVGAVINLEARGGGGRAMMFETGPGNAQTIDLFTRTTARADGGATSNSLAVLVYELMPNGTDFTISREKGIAGINMAFLGRPAQYHTAASTPEALDQGSLQHIGSQALEATDALLRAPALPRATENRVYADILGKVIISHPPAVGWVLLGLAVVLFGFALWRVRAETAMPIVDLGRGALEGIWVIAAGLVLVHAMRVLSGPQTTMEAYYLLLDRLPWIEMAAGLALTAVCLAVLAGKTRIERRAAAGAIALGVLIVWAPMILARTAPGPLEWVVLVAGVVAGGLALWDQSTPRTTWGGWLGLIGLVGLLAIPAQAIAPGAAFLLIWPVLLASAAAALSAVIGARLTSTASLIPPAVATVLGGAWIVYLAHPVFLGIGMDLPGVLAPLGLLVLMFVRPLAPQGLSRVLAGAAAVCLLLGCAVAGAAWVVPA